MPIILAPKTLLLHKAILRVELTNGNSGRGHSWYSKADDRNEIETILRCDRHQRRPFPYQVEIHLTRILGKRQQLWDSDSGLRGNSKELIDALVVLGWFHDDNPHWVSETRFFQDSTQRKNGPCVLIEIFADPK
jgi:hypothetical protein